VRLFFVALSAACSFGGAPSGEPGPPAPPPADAPILVAPRQVCVIRHAESYKNLGLSEDQVPRGEYDSLTPAGQERARAMREELPSPVGFALVSPTGRTLQTVDLLALAVSPRPEATLRELVGEASWQDRLAAAARGEDLRPLHGESFADGAGRARHVLTKARERTPPGQHAVLVTHGDMGPLILGEIAGTPLLERPVAHALQTGEVRCAPLDAADDG
jgi:broad specificity phosphatase PhoE